MKKLPILGLLFLSFIFSACSSNQPTNSVTPVNSIEDVYKLYLVNGGTQSYEEWLASIKGEKGDPGITPHIGDNGHWFIGDTDTGINAKGDKGDPGQKGEPGSASSTIDCFGKKYYQARFTYQYSGDGTMVPNESYYLKDYWLEIEPETITIKNDAQTFYRYPYITSGNTFYVTPKFSYYDNRIMPTNDNLKQYIVISEDQIYYQEFHYNDVNYGLYVTEEYAIAHNFIEEHR